MTPGRRHLGIEVTLGVEVRLPSGEPMSGATTELRLDGMVLDSRESLRVGQVVEFRITGISLNLDGHASVVGCEAAGGRHRVDLAFSPDMSFIARERLAQFLVGRRKRVEGG